MNIIEAAKTRTKCFRPRVPGGRAVDFTNPAASVTLVVGDLLLDDWQEDTERTRLEAELAAKAAEAAALAAQAAALAAAIEALKTERDDWKAKAEAKPKP